MSEDIIIFDEYKYIDLSLLPTPKPKEGFKVFFFSTPDNTIKRDEDNE